MYALIEIKLNTDDLKVDYFKNFIFLDFSLYFGATLLS